MASARVVRTVIGCLIIACGIVWSILFPKTGDVLRPDFVLSVVLGIGLIVTGILFLFVVKTRAVALFLSILFLWSILANVFFLAQLRTVYKVVLDIPSMEAQNAQQWLSILESDREDKIEHLSSRLREVIHNNE